LEMCYRQHQRFLDAFIFGDGSIEKLFERTNWSETWGYPMSHYEKIFSFARDEKIRLVGLNCPRELVSMVGKYGVDALPADFAPYLPEMDLHNATHYQRFTDALAAAGASHGSRVPQEKLAKMYEAQTLWDEYMAESIALHMTSPPPARFAAQLARPEPALSKAPARMVVLAGTNHVQGHVGIPDRFTRRTKLPTFSMVPISVPWTPLGEPVLQEPPPGASEAEWLLYTPPPAWVV